MIDPDPEYSTGAPDRSVVSAESRTVAALAVSSSSSVSTSMLSTEPLGSLPLPPLLGSSSLPLSSTAAVIVPPIRTRAATPAATRTSVRLRRLRANRCSSSAADRIGTSASSGPATGWPSRSRTLSRNGSCSIRRPLRNVPSCELFVNVQPPGVAVTWPCIREQTGSVTTTSDSGRRPTVRWAGCRNRNSRPSATTSRSGPVRAGT